MIQRTFFALAAVCVILSASVAKAQTVTYTLSVDEGGSGTFSLYATTDMTNGGISGYGVDLTGTITSLDHSSPIAAFSAATNGPVGFDLGRSADGGNFVLGSQNIVHATWPAGAIYGMGQTASDFASEGLAPVFTTEGDFWGSPHASIPGAPLLLATGTYSGAPDSLGFDVNGPNLGANVFANVGDTGVVTATTAFQIITGTVPPQNLPPTAGINGPFNIDIATDPLNITLDASSSTDDGLTQALTYKWDLDGDGNYDDADTGAVDSFAIADVTALFALDTPTTVGVEVYDGEFFSTVTTTVTVTNSIPEPTTLGLAILGLCGVIARRRRNA